MPVIILNLFIFRKESGERGRRRRRDVTSYESADVIRTLLTSMLGQQLLCEVHRKYSIVNY